MKRMKKNTSLIIIPLLMLSFFAFSGFDCESQGIELRIIGTIPETNPEITGGFSGYYVINGGSEELFTSSGEPKNGLHIFSQDFGTFRFIEITATKTDSRATLDMYLFDQNGNILQKVTNSSCSTSTTSTATCSNSSSMSYTFRSGR
jgi:hypothetical protein